MCSKACLEKVEEFCKNTLQSFFVTTFSSIKNDRNCFLPNLTNQIINVEADKDNELISSTIYNNEQTSSEYILQIITKNLLKTFSDAIKCQKSGSTSLCKKKRKRKRTKKNKLSVPANDSLISTEKNNFLTNMKTKLASSCSNNSLNLEDQYDRKKNKNFDQNDSLYHKDNGDRNEKTTVFQFTEFSNTNNLQNETIRFMKKQSKSTSNATQFSLLNSNQSVLCDIVKKDKSLTSILNDEICQINLDCTTRIKRNKQNQHNKNYSYLMDTGEKNMYNYEKVGTKGSSTCLKSEIKKKGRCHIISADSSDEEYDSGHESKGLTDHKKSQRIRNSVHNTVARSSTHLRSNKNTFANKDRQRRERYKDLSSYTAYSSSDESQNRSYKRKHFKSNESKNFEGRKRRTSPSFHDRRRITSARKPPTEYNRRENLKSSYSTSSNKSLHDRLSVSSESDSHSHISSNSSNSRSKKKHILQSSSSSSS